MGKLYLVPTPIGNLNDMTLRAIQILKSVRLILAEDTRTSSFLLKHFEIDNRLMAHHKFNEHQTVQMLIARLAAGEEMALITDAGTPAISDPGFLLVRACIEAEIEVECLPGATALIPALVNSGLPSDRFVFEGFLPPKKGRKTRLTQLATEQRTLIFYESPFRLVRTLQELALYFGPSRRASVSRELTKMHEETCRGTLQELAALFGARSAIKGEIVLVVEGYND
ncbi:MAG: 16S rRNA (cytidine(1402)-2'-O)-methyltransferase [Bacteroidales bacterium]